MKSRYFIIVLLGLLALSAWGDSPPNSKEQATTILEAVLRKFPDDQEAKDIRSALE